MTIKMKTKEEIKKDAKTAWIVGIIILIISLILEFFMHPHAYFEIDGWRFFNAWYGFLSCIGIIIVSKSLSFLKRAEDYYEEDQE